MPIEFRCPTCSSLLRTPDESAGKKAKCPQCGTIADVPSALVEGPFAGIPASPKPPSPEPENPFADAAAPGLRDAAGPATADNPYASPYATAPDAFAAGGVAQGALRQRQIDFAQVLRQTWDIFSTNMGPCALVGLVMFGIAMGLQVIGQIGGIATQASGEVAAVALFQIVDTVFGFVVQVWMNLGVLYFALRLIRTGQATVGDFFAVGPYFLRGILITLLVGAIIVAILAVCLLPAAGVFFAAGGPNAFQDNPAPVVATALIGASVAAVLITWVTLRVYLGFAFLLDRNTGVLDSLGRSDAFMRGNKLTTFLIMLVVGLVGGAFACVTCTFGVILLNPYVGVLKAVVYLQASGRPQEDLAKA